ncbi:hypothetical protein GCM10023189_39000 [Nibrella saemangeumensis]|uniref:Uncharacterized protein n=1 Tax=Nibrella saemangeumensis TaxID=1084526 RepID=A0ABP8NA38_9BACT
MDKILFIFLLLAACQSVNDSIYQPPTDLVISNPVWTRSDPNHIYDEVEVCEHDFTLTNNSDSLTQIIVRISYFDRQHRLMDEHLHKVWHEIKPHESFRVKGLSGGIVKPGTDSASVDLVKAIRKIRQIH